MAKLKARGRTELFRMKGSWLVENREAEAAFMSDGKVLMRHRTFGFNWSKWTVAPSKLDQTALEARFTQLGYKKVQAKNA